MDAKRKHEKALRRKQKLAERGAQAKSHAPKESVRPDIPGQPPGRTGGYSGDPHAKPKPSEHN